MCADSTVDPAASLAYTRSCRRFEPRMLSVPYEVQISSFEDASLQREKPLPLFSTSHRVPVLTLIDTILGTRSLD